MGYLRDAMLDVLSDAEKRVQWGAHGDGLRAGEPDDDCPSCRGHRYVHSGVTDPSDPLFGHLLPCDWCKPRLGLKRLARLHRESVLGTSAYAGMRFETFLARPDQYTALHTCLAYAQDPAARPLLTLLGQNGTGKSHLAAAICFQYAAAHGLPLFYTAQDLVERIQATFGRDADDMGNTAQVIGSFKAAPLLVIDELGAHHASEWAESELYGIVNARYAASLPTVITSNLPLDKIGQRPGMRDGDSRWASRLLDRERAGVVVLTCPDMRDTERPRDTASAPLFDRRATEGPHHARGYAGVVCPVCNCRPHFAAGAVRCPEGGA